MKKILTFIFSVVLCACTDMNLKTQRIQSATDCIESYNWSWNNGTAVSDNYVDYGDGTHSETPAKFSFKSKLTGTLKFEYALEDKSKADLEVKIDGTSCFHVKYNSEESYPSSANMTNVPKNVTVEFVGMYCTVSNIEITSVEEKDAEQSWDF